MLVSFHIYSISFFWQPLALWMLICVWGSRGTVIPTSNNGGSWRQGYTISGLDSLVSTSVQGGDEALWEHCLSSFRTRFLTVYHCADQEGSYFIVTSPPLSTSGLATAVENRGCPLPPIVSRSSRIWQEKRALPPRACCSMGLLPARKRDSIPWREVIALETSLNIWDQSGWTSSPGAAPAVARSLGRGCAPGCWGLCQGAAPRGLQGWCCALERASDKLQKKTTALEMELRTTGLGEPNHKTEDLGNYKPGKQFLVL